MSKSKPENLEELFEEYRKEDEALVYEWYGAITGLLKDLVYKDNPLLKTFKSDNFTGSTYTLPIPLKYDKK